jgi:hypothetical protein
MLIIDWHLFDGFKAVEVLKSAGENYRKLCQFLLLRYLLEHICNVSKEE